MNHGYYSITNYWYSNVYIFDLDNLAKSFQKDRLSTTTIIQFENFQNPYIGYNIFKRLLPLQKLNMLDIEVDKTIKENKSLSIRQIEFNYICNFLRLKAEKSSYENNKNIFDQLISYRQKKINEKEDIIENSINKKFG